MIDYREFEELLTVDEGINPYTTTEEKVDELFSIEREFFKRFENEALDIEVNMRNRKYSLTFNKEENEWNFSESVDNREILTKNGSYKECIQRFFEDVKYEDLFMELARQGKLENINNINEKGEKEGLWVISKEDGKKEIAYFKEDKLQGKYAELDINNKISKIGNYQNNYKQGEAFVYNTETNKLKEIRTYNYNEIRGLYKNYAYNGELESEGNIGVFGKIDGEVRSYQTDKNGKLYLWQISNFNDGVEEGKVTNFYPSGQIETKFMMKNNEIEGECVSYYESGNIKEIENYEKSRLNGVRTTYYESGKVKEKMNYVDDRLHGDKVKYSKELGRVKQDKYNSGLLEQELFYINGQLRHAKNYNLGQLKEELIFDKNFNKTMEVTYGENKTTNWKGYYPNKNLQFERHLENNLFTGENKTYYENGNLQEVITYKIVENTSLKDGKYESYYENGSLQEKGTYKEDKKEGEWIKYSQANKITEKSIYKAGEKQNAMKTLVKEVKGKMRELRSRVKGKGQER